MKVVSLFSGAGGLDLGFKMAGHEIVWANDNFPEAVETYKKNLGDHIICEDIYKIDVSKIPDCDIVVGGFPCQGFSIANMKRHADDSRNELYRMLIKVITEKNPKFFVAENVKGILSLEHGEVIKMIMNDFNSIGYTAVYKVLNAADYGVPQLRKRVIIVGVRNDVNFKYEYPTPTHNENGDNGLRKWVSVGDAVKNIPDPDQPNNVLNHTYSQFKLKFNGYIGNRAIDPNKPAPTVTARGDDKGGVVVLHHPNNKRRMTCRELATVQSFPLDYEFVGNRSSIYRQIGNAVPPLLGKAIAEQFNLYTGE
jgi:DNA (cytosine-5)-methyltransferase 1